MLGLDGAIRTIPPEVNLEPLEKSTGASGTHSSADSSALFHVPKAGQLY